MLYKPRARIELSVLRFGADAEQDPVSISPAIIECHWERNHHLMADTLSATIPWIEGGVDPRYMKNARCAFWMWDANYEEFNESKHLRFTGICKNAKRSMTEAAMHVELKFHDYTDMFINMKPYPSDGIPEFSDTLTSAWQKICDNTGWWDSEGQKIISSVAAFRDALVIDPTINPAIASRTIGGSVTTRFHAVAKPTPPSKANAWETWQYICAMMGVLSYIDGDQCIVTTDAALYSQANAPAFIQGINLYDLSEEADSAISNKAILLKSYDPLAGVQLEAIYPPAGDVRVKTPRAAARREAKGKGAVNTNDISGELEEFFRYDITDQATLDAAAEEAYATRNRQELSGEFKTVEMRIEEFDHPPVDILTLGCGDTIEVGIDLAIREVRNIAGGTWGTGIAEQIAYLTETLGYDEGLARLIISNLSADEIENPRYHLKSLDVHFGPEKFEVELKYHNVIQVNT